MADIYYFKPRKDLLAHQNLNAFVAFSQNALPTWCDIDGFSWEANRWVTTHGTIRFTNEENCKMHSSWVPAPDQLMHPKIIEIAKAYIRYRHHLSPHRNIARETSAFRALDYVIRQDMANPDITKVTQKHFDKSVKVLSRLKAVSILANELLRILKNLADYGIVTTRAHHWTHPYTGDLSYDSTNGAYAPQSIKDKKVPHQDALLAIGDVFSRGYNDSLEDSDTLVTSLTAILLGAPMRIGEVIRFRTDCLGCEQDKDGKNQYYLKYWVPKTKEYTRKPIPPAMAGCVIEAVKRLTEMTEDGRRLARHMEANPTEFYRHTTCPAVTEDQVLTRDQVAQALGFASRKNVESYIKKRTGSHSLTGFTLRSLWQLVIQDHKKHNPHFPYQELAVGATVLPLKMSESLLCTRRLQFSVTQQGSPVLLTPFNPSYYGKRLNAMKYKGRSRPMCFFTRHGFAAIKLKSHSIRHMLNRMAQQSGLTVDVITAWSNRSSFQQTLTYLDNDRGEAAAAATSLLGEEIEQSPKDPITNEEAQIYAGGPIHRSRYGLCRRTWRMGPCNKFGDCLNCSELLMCKGDTVAARVIAQDRDNLAMTYNAALDAIQRVERSATRWLKVAQPQVERLGQLLAILNDPDIEDGTPVEIAGTDFSHEGTLISEKASKAGIKFLDRSKLVRNYGNDLLACLDELREPRDA